MKTTPIPVKFDRQGHSCNFFAGFGPTFSGVVLPWRCSWYLASFKGAPLAFASAGGNADGARAQGCVVVSAQNYRTPSRGDARRARAGMRGARASARARWVCGSRARAKIRGARVRKYKGRASVARQRDAPVWCASVALHHGASARRASAACQRGVPACRASSLRAFWAGRAWRGRPGTERPAGIGGEQRTHTCM